MFFKECNIKTTGHPNVTYLKGLLDIILDELVKCLHVFFIHQFVSVHSA